MAKTINILMATDFTEASENALSQVDTLFRDWYGWEVNYLLVHSFKPWAPYSNTPSIPTIPNRELETQLKERLQKTAEDLKNGTGKQSQIRMFFKQGALQQAVSDIVKNENPDLIVMGSREKSAFQRMTLGGNTMKIASTQKHPVLDIPKGAKFELNKKMVLISDAENPEITTNSFDLLKRITSEKKSKLTALKIYSSEEPKQPKKEIEDKEAYSFLADIPHGYQAITYGNLYDGIKSIIREHKPDLVIIIPQQRDFLEKIFHTSDSEKVVYHAELPVLILN